MPTTNYTKAGADAKFAPIASPALTGTPTSTTAAATDNSTRVATTAYANGLINSFGLGGPAALATGDWNNYLTTGFYRGSGLTNSPTSDWYYVTVINHNSDNLVQIAQHFYSTNYYVRVKAAGTWGNWSNLAIVSIDGGGGFTLNYGAATQTNRGQLWRSDRIVTFDIDFTLNAGTQIGNPIVQIPAAYYPVYETFGVVGVYYNNGWSGYAIVRMSNTGALSVQAAFGSNGNGMEIHGTMSWRT